MHSVSRIPVAALLPFILLWLPAGAQQSAPEEPVAQAAPAPSDPAAQPPAELAAPPHSKTRIVRLSEVKGEVQLDRNSGKGFETPMANLPIVEGDRLKTGQGVAEIEFEDNSTVRVAPDSLVEFPKLELLPGGVKASAVLVRQGTVYATMVKTKDNEFTLMFGKDAVQLPPESHVRLQLTPGRADLAVLHGDVQVVEPAGVTQLSKNKTMSFNLAGDSAPQIAKNVEEMPTDGWDHDAAQYHKNFANASAYGGSPYAYGINDMNYYGSFINAGGCGGSMWRPYFTSASWNPYGSGAWAYYGNAGYSWVSPYPWGWTPFHYGSWNYCQGVGWGWRPGGEWMGIANVAPTGTQNLLNRSATVGTHPLPPTHPPVIARSIVPVNLKEMPVSAVNKENNFVFRGNSAGMGVPRGSLGKLNSFSGQTASRGSASTPVYMGGARGGVVASNSLSNASNTGGTMRAGSSPSSASSHSNSSGMQSSAGGGGMSHASSGAGGGGGASGGGGGHR